MTDQEYKRIAKQLNQRMVEAEKAGLTSSDYTDLMGDLSSIGRHRLPEKIQTASPAKIEKYKAIAEKYADAPKSFRKSGVKATRKKGAPTDEEKLWRANYNAMRVRANQTMRHLEKTGASNLDVYIRLQETVQEIAKPGYTDLSKAPKLSELEVTPKEASFVLSQLINDRRTKMEVLNKRQTKDLQKMAVEEQTAYFHGADSGYASLDKISAGARRRYYYGYYYNIFRKTLRRNHQVTASGLTSSQIDEVAYLFAEYYENAQRNNKYLDSEQVLNEIIDAVIEKSKSAESGDMDRYKKVEKALDNFGRDVERWFRGTGGVNEKYDRFETYYHNVFKERTK